MLLPPNDLDELRFGTTWSRADFKGSPLAGTGAERWFLWLGASLTLLGPLAFVVSSEVGATALVPMIFGLSLIGLSLVSLQSDKAWRWNLFALIAFGFALGDGLRGLKQVPGLIQGLEFPSPGPIVTQSIMALLCLAFLAPILVRLSEQTSRQPGPSPARLSR